MEDHEPSDLIPLFNGMVISFINYELQVRIEPKTPEELAHSPFDATLSKDVVVPASAALAEVPEKETPRGHAPSQSLLAAPQ
jgi:hypothetical protein